MSITTTTRKRLWQRTGNRCAKCRCELHEDATEHDDPSILGEECHIVGDKPGSARYEDPLPLDQRDDYSNLVILCTRCHKVVDDQRETYLVEVLRKLKADHEQWVREALADERDPAKERDELLFAQIVDEWGQLSALDRWEKWGSYVLGSGQPKMSAERHAALHELKKWLFGRVWPHRYPRLRSAFENFRHVLQDFLDKFDQHARPVGPGGGLLETEKFYKRGGFVEDPKTQDTDYTLGPLFDYHVDLVQDLLVELTRAANYVCDRVREFVSPTFRLKEGLVLLSFSPDFLSVQTLRPEYRGAEREDQPYPGLDEFLSARGSRDFRFGSGPPPNVPSSET